MSEKQDERLERFWKQPDGLPTDADDKERGRAYAEWVEQAEVFSPMLVDAVKKLVRGEL
jgi:hypothetical protein